MCCCIAGFIVKYVLFIANVVFAFAGLAILGLGIAVHIQIQEIEEVIPVNALSIIVIVLGCVVFIISCLACCGAIRESRCMLITYAIFMAILAGIKIYLTVEIFNFLSSVLSTVSGWIVTAFQNESLNQAFHVMENLFQCCGTVGAVSYAPAGYIPPSCCPSNFTECVVQNSYPGCINVVSDYLEVFGEAIGVVLIVVIIIELVCVLFGLFLSCQIRSKRYAAA